LGAPALSNGVSRSSSCTNAANTAATHALSQPVVTGVPTAVNSRVRVGNPRLPSSANTPAVLAFRLDLRRPSRPEVVVIIVCNYKEE